MATLTNLFWKSYRLVPDALRKPIRERFRKQSLAVNEMYLAKFYNGDTGEVLPGFPITAKDTVLDVGCGPGASVMFAARRGAEVIAVDVDPGEIAKVKHSLGQQATARAYETYVSDSNPLPLPDGRATRIIAQEVMEHVDCPKRFLSELHRVGKPGALYLITVPDPASEEVMKKISPEICWQKPYHIHVYGREEFPQLVTDAGLEVLSVTRGSSYWSMWWFLMWGSEIKGDLAFGSGQAPALHHWNMLWSELIKTPNGRKVRAALDECIPKSQRIIARKPA